MKKSQERNEKVGARKLSSDLLLNQHFNTKKTLSKINSISPVKPAQHVNPFNGKNGSAMEELNLVGVDFTTQKAIEHNIQALNELVPSQTDGDSVIGGQT